MSNLEVRTSPEVEQIFANYPDVVRNKMQFLRALVIETATEIESITVLEETLKWGEPSYLTRKGSTIRMDYKPRFAQQYALYFQCTSRLVETFKMMYTGIFQFEEKRAIIFHINDEIATDELKSCIRAALTYHSVKHLPTLGI